MTATFATLNGTTEWPATVTEKESTNVFKNFTDSNDDAVTTQKSTMADTGFDYNKVAVVTVPLFTIFGIAGNILSLVIMRSKYFKTSTTSIHLSALALSDTTFILVSPFTKVFINDLFPRDPRALTENGCKAFFCIFRTAKICSSWFMVIICIERFIVVWFPLHVKSILSRRTALICTSVVVVVVFTFDGVWTITSGIVNGVCLPSVVTPSTKDLAAGFVIAGTAIFNIIPTCVIVLLTPLMIFKLFKHKKLRRSVSNQVENPHDGRVTRMLLAVMTAYLTLVTPISVAHSVAFFNGDNIFESTVPSFIVFRNIAQILEQLNYTINFFLYASFNETFRREFFSLLGFKCDDRPQQGRTQTLSSNDTPLSSVSQTLSTGMA